MNRPRLSAKQYRKVDESRIVFVPFASSLQFQLHVMLLPVVSVSWVPVLPEPCPQAHTRAQLRVAAKRGRETV